MTETCVLPEFSLTQAEAAVASLYGVTGEFILLNGERDLNYRIKSEDQSANQFVFKICNAEESKALLDCQDEVFQLLNRGLEPSLSQQSISPETVTSKKGNTVETIKDDKGETYFCRMVKFIDGPLLSAINPHTPRLLESLGETLGNFDKSLETYRHTALSRPLLWDMTHGAETVSRFLPLIEDEDNRHLIEMYLKRFKDNVLPVAQQLRTSVIHNDGNDNNIVVHSKGPWQQSVKGLIDFGDMVESWTVVDPAVACAYVMLDKGFPLDQAGSVIKGYHRAYPLGEVEISTLFDFICMRLCMSVCLCAHQISLEPDNAYLRISEKPAWSCLHNLSQISPRFAHFYFREKCGFEPVPNHQRIVKYLSGKSSACASIVSIDLKKAPLLMMDTSVGSPYLPGPAQAFDPAVAAREISRTLSDTGNLAGIGKYDEYRLIYDSDDFADNAGHRRTLHLGMDIFMEKGTALYAPLSGKVHALGNNDAPLDYGGTLMLEHAFKDTGKTTRETIKFYSLYGHLNPESLAEHVIGNEIAQGQFIARMGDIHENGNWPPHVHFQIITDMLEERDTFAGVGTHEHRNVWLSLCPDPNIILGIPNLAHPHKSPEFLIKEIDKSRKKNLNPSLSLSYQNPIHMVRGERQYMYDFTGRRYLDAVNNVPHVGHCHPHVVAASSKQHTLLNTNTRYLYDSIQHYSERLLDKFPDPLNVCYLVNSGSEANDLALRLAKTYTGKSQMIVVDHAYHGNLSSLIDISPYKHNSPGGGGSADHVHTAMMPDPFRNGCERVLTQSLNSIKQCIEKAHTEGGPALFIAESVLGCGGQIVLPDHYLDSVYPLIREAGGVCIADEVQVGFGRVGTHFWGYETQGVVPDIVTMGKPIGNGHPLAAVVTTREIADAFNNGMEYFNTFGGNPVSCEIGNAVLDVMEFESLQENALSVGKEFLLQLKEQQNIFEIIGDVRGLGLFIGIELIKNKQTLEPANEQASYIAERMKQEGILISTDGPLHNVLKIKPPMCFNHKNIDIFVAKLNKILKETFAQLKNE